MAASNQQDPRMSLQQAQAQAQAQGTVVVGGPGLGTPPHQVLLFRAQYAATATLPDSVASSAFSGVSDGYGVATDMAAAMAAMAGRVIGAAAIAGGASSNGAGLGQGQGQGHGGNNGGEVSGSVSNLLSGQGYYTVESLEGGAQEFLHQFSSMASGSQDQQLGASPGDGLELASANGGHEYGQKVMAGYSSSYHMLMPHLDMEQARLIPHAFGNGLHLQHPGQQVQAGHHLGRMLPMGLYSPIIPDPSYMWLRERELELRRRQLYDYQMSRDRTNFMRKDTYHQDKFRFRRKKGKLPPKPQAEAKPCLVGPEGPGWCSICEVDCNTLDVLEQHRGGKKHKKQLQKLENEALQVHNKRTQTGSAQDVDTNVEAGNHVSNNSSSQTGKRTGEVESRQLAKRPRHNSDIHSNVDTVDGLPVLEICEACSISCNSATVMDSHLKGKKHASKLKRLQEEAQLGNQEAIMKLALVEEKTISVRKAMEKEQHAPSLGECSMALVSSMESRDNAQDISSSLEEHLRYSAWNNSCLTQLDTLQPKSSHSSVRIEELYSEGEDK